jgi:hypothetical protein
VSDTIMMGGGWHGDVDTVHRAAPWMSDQLARDLARCEAFERQDAARAEQERQRRVAELAEVAQRSAAVLAEQRGEWVSPRDALRSWFGRTPGEAKAYAVAQMDLEDARQMALLRRAHPAWTDDAIHQAYSADMTAPTPDELAEAKQDEVVERARRRQTRRRHAADKHLRNTMREEILLHEWGY